MNLKLIIFLPILEIVAFILFGDLFGFFPAIFFILITGFFGLYLLKSNLNIKEITETPENWIYKKIAGILLLIPGVITDILGLILIFKSFRSIISRYIPEDLKKNMHKKYKKNTNEITDIEYRDLDE